MSSYKVNRDSYLKMIDGIVYGEDPRQGYVESGVFYHPELKFQFPVPTNWQLENSPSQVQMAPADGKALMIFTLAEGSYLQAPQIQSAGFKCNSKQAGHYKWFEALEVMSQQVSTRSIHR